MLLAEQKGRHHPVHQAILVVFVRILVSKTHDCHHKYIDLAHAKKVAHPQKNTG